MIARLIISVIVGSWVFTQALAFQGHYRPALGGGVGSVQAFFMRHTLYLPWAGYRWAWQYAPLPGRMLRMAVVLGALGAGLPLLGTMVRRRQVQVTGHGTARWGTARDLKRAGLYSSRGIVLGRHQGRIVRYNGPKNVLVCMPPRSGKGTGVLIPTLLTTPERHCVCIDVRGESYEATVGYRATQGRVVRYELTSPMSVRHNPLLEIRRGTDHEYSDAFLIADILVDPVSAKDRRDHWDETARNMLIVGSLYLIHRRPHPSLAQLASLYSQPGQSVDTILSQIEADAPTTTIAELAAELRAKDAKELSAVQSSTLAALAAWRNPLIARNTGASDFTLADFQQQAPFITLYLIVSPADDLVIRAPLRVFLNQLTRRLTESGGLQHTKMDLLLDEFPFLGRLDFFAQHLALLGGYGIRSVLALQNIPQIETLYGTADRILEQCHIQVYSGAIGGTTARVMSAQSGMTTATTPQRSQQYAGGGLIATGVGMNEQQHSRALLLIDEARTFHEDELLLLAGGTPASRLTKTPFWSRREWRSRSAMPYTTGETHAAI
jgi:type IV secretion system protein VirD4